ncbi:uncharacterized protein [Drosophila bipectinata]|uniref:uncharacterized protein n=1 Tax=Drosophila bipectinata TaxID=42026 RepID=UPI001C8AF406|nr:uncharacterized protein LOC108126125 [Drosophila bipectinata]
MRKVLHVLIILEWLSLIFSHVTFTNLKCGTNNRKVAEFEKCYIKAVNRTHKYVDVYVKLHKPLDNMAMNLKLLRYDQGYKPFFIDMTFDCCQFLKNQQNPIIKFFYDVYKDNSNVNHTCPIDHDIIVDHVWTGNIESGISKYIPIINGDYSPVKYALIVSCQ